MMDLKSRASGIEGVKYTKMIIFTSLIPMSLLILIWGLILE